MGDFQNILNPGAALIGGVSGTDSEAYDWFNQISDPMDLFGVRAGNTRDESSNIAMQGAADSITAQEEMRQIVEEMLGPYRQAGLDALPGFNAMAAGGNAEMQMSPQYQFERQQGLQNINRGLGAQGRRMSTYGGKQTGNFLNALGQEEANRQYGYNLDPIKIGMGALGTIGNTNASAGQTVGNTLSQTGSNLNSIYQNYGQNRQNSFNQAGNAMNGLASYMAYNSGPSYSAGNMNTVSSSYPDYGQAIA
jgi:hypothetical protein